MLELCNNQANQAMNGPSQNRSDQLFCVQDEDSKVGGNDLSLMRVSFVLNFNK